MKAYRAWDEKALDPCATIVFAENIKEAVEETEKKEKTSA